MAPAGDSGGLSSSNHLATSSDNNEAARFSPSDALTNLTPGPGHAPVLENAREPNCRAQLFGERLGRVLGYRVLQHDNLFGGCPMRWAYGNSAYVIVDPGTPPSPRLGILNRRFDWRNIYPIPAEDVVFAEPSFR
jgi:hypothetical protein